MNPESRAALVDLLLLVLHLDNHLSLMEDAAFEKALASLGWEPGRTGDLDLTAAFARVRAATADDLGREEFLRSRVALVRSHGDASTAFEWLGKVLGADGLDAVEHRFLKRLRKLLFD